MRSRLGGHEAFLGVVGLSFLGQLTVLAYDIALSHRFGTSPAADSIAFGFTLAHGLGNEIAGWVGVLLVPRLLEVEAREGQRAARTFAASTLVAVTLLAGVLGLGLVALGPSLWTLSGRDRGSDDVIALFSPLVMLLPVSAVLAGTLQARNRFAIASLRQVWWYGGALLAIVVMSPRVGPAAVPAGMAVGLLLYTILLGALILPPLSARAVPDVRVFAAQMGPLVAMSVANYAHIVLERGLAAHTGDGGVAALTYAFRIVNGPVTLLVVTASTMLFTAMSARVARQGPAAVHALAGPAVRLGVLLTLPAAGLVLGYARPLVRVLFERGAFTSDSVQLTAIALFYYAPGLLGATLLQILLRAHWALGHVRFVARTQVAVAAFGACALLLLYAVLGFRGLPIAWSVTVLAHGAALLAGLGRETIGAGPSLARLCAKALVGSTAIVIIAVLTAITLPTAWIQLLVGVPLSLAAYLLVMHRIASVESRAALELLRGGR